MRTSRIGKTLATLTATTVVALGGTLATAPTAAAVGGSACSVNIPNKLVHVGNSGATVRSGPGKSYTKKGFLPAGNSFYARCYKTNRYGNTWMYGDPGGTTYRGWIYWV